MNDGSNLLSENFHLVVFGVFSHLGDFDLVFFFPHGHFSEVKGRAELNCQSSLLTQVKVG